MPQLREYQRDAVNNVYKSWDAGAENTLLVLPTGAGKTVIMSNILDNHAGASVAIAHRQELVSQISMALARSGVRHRIIGPKNVIKLCVALHTAELGRSFFHPEARTGVAGVDTLVRRGDSLREWLNSVTLWAQDEAHHPLKTNKWGKAAEMFPRARGLGVTATPLRADGKGLGRDYDGIFDDMVIGPNMRDLIRRGFLTEYRIFAPPSDYQRPESVGGSGDFTFKGMSSATKQSHIVGDIVAHYVRIANGKPGVTFVPDVDTAHDVAAQFCAAGVPAVAVSAKTPDRERIDCISRFKRGELRQLVNVDLFGEGFDLPAIEVVSMGRPTESYGLYVQQFGRALRLLEGKTHGIIIDHVGNVDRHGLPDAPREWSLERRERKSNSGPSDVIPTWVCRECVGVWECFIKICPACGAGKPLPAVRSGPEFVDGDLTELDPAALAEMRGEIEKIDMDAELYRESLTARNVPLIGQAALVKKHYLNQAAQAELRDGIALWAGHRRAEQTPDAVSYMKFYHRYGLDVMSAQALKANEAHALLTKIKKDLEI